MKKLLTLIASTISIFALVSCNDVDTSSTTSVVTSSSSSQITSVSSDTSSDESSSIEFSSSEEESSSIEEISSSIEESSSESSEGSSIQVTYHVRFVNYNDELLYETDVLEGEGATYLGETPTRESEGDSTFEFLRWDKDFSVVTSDLVVKAVYAEHAKDEGGWSPIIRF